MPKVSRSRRRNSRSNTRRSTRRSRSRSNRRSRRVSRRTLRSRSRRSLRGGSGFRVPKGTPNYKTMERQREAELKSAPLTGDQQWCMDNLPLCEKIKTNVYKELKTLGKL